MTKRLCEVPGCEGEHVARGFCANHYAQKKNAGEFTNIRPRDGKQGCAVQDCEGRHYSRGLCASHYNNLRMFGQPVRPVKTREVKICSFDPCDRTAHSVGLCRGHYNQKWLGRELSVFKRRSPGRAAYEAAYEELKAGKTLKEVSDERGLHFTALSRHFKRDNGISLREFKTQAKAGARK